MSEFEFFKRQDVLSHTNKIWLQFKQNAFTICDERAGRLGYTSPVVEQAMLDEVTLPFIKGRNINPEALSQELLGYMITIKDVLSASKAYDDNTVDAQFEIVDEQPTQQGAVGLSNGMKLLPFGGK